MTFPGGITDWLLTTVTGGVSAGAGFFFVRWLMGVNPPDWNSGITLTPPGTNATQQLEFPAEEPPPRGFFEEDPTFTYPMYWWF